MQSESLEQEQPEVKKPDLKPDPKDQQFDRIWWIFVYSCLFLALVLFVLIFTMFAVAHLDGSATA